MATTNSRAEILEAIQAADVALDHLEAAANQLDRANSWGLADVLGGSFLSTFMKHRRMDDAQDELEQARDAVRAFARELADVDRSLGLDIEVSGFLSFADYFFDGVVADWIVQRKIADAMEQVEQAVRKIVAVRNRLVRML
ncbi:hypothetical protein [uncultured Parolsenella sp.]|uniref:hypothetical protein n=1 Tax=uncultured Parolsenella sp. TaxID=2083008 RepID=UPI0027D99500|nr:hypothetical protein [uncultured Parolsenella sp.]